MDIQVYNEAINFMKNKHKNEPMQSGVSNLYVIRRIDRAGNVLETKFGENLMTDYGFLRHFTSSSSVSWPTYLYVGDGIPTSGHFSQDQQTLENLISSTALTNSNTTKDYACPFFYDAASSSTEQGGLVTVFCQYLVAYMDYSNSTYGIADQSKLIYEFGIGESSTQLWTHSRVYTSSGAPTHVTKNNDERLEFTVFLCLSYYESLIMNGWNDLGHVDGKYGKYTVITSPARMFDKMKPSTIYSFQRNNQKNVSLNFTSSSTAVEETYVSATQVLSSFTLETYAGDGKIMTANGYIDGFVNNSSGFCIVEREELDHLVDIDMIMHPSTPYENGMSDAFGVRDWYRFTQLEQVSSVSMFDYTTNTWVNAEQFVNDSRKWYDETPLMTGFGKAIYYMSNNTVQKLYVYQNINQLDGITSITSGNLIVYMASKYWDVSTWVNIQDILHIPAEYKNYKYILTADNSVDLTVKRELPCFNVIPRAGTGSSSYGFTKVRGYYITLDNYAYGWFKGDTIVYFPESRMTYTTSSDFSMTWNKWLVNYNYSSTLTVYDMTNVASQHPQTLTSYTVTPAFSSAVTNIANSTYKTDSQTGLICIYHKSTSQAVVIDLTSFDGSTFTTNELIPACALACCIGNTRKVAYILSSAIDTIVIYDYDTHQITNTLTIPSLTGTPSIMIGLNGKLWLSDGSTSNSYCFDISTGTYQSCNNYIPWNSSDSSDYRYFRYSFTNNFFVGYDYTQSFYNHTRAFVVRADDPTNVKVLTNLKYSNSNPSWSKMNITLRNVETLTSNHTCAMIISGGMTLSGYTGAFNAIIDLGYYYFNTDNTFGLDNYYHNLTFNNNSLQSNTDGAIIPYGQFVIVNNSIMTPLEYPMPHRVIAKTRTITTQYGYKNISGKTWTTTFTNTPKFHGLPPGTMATLNR